MNMFGKVGHQSPLLATYCWKSCKLETRDSRHSQPKRLWCNLHKAQFYYYSSFDTKLGVYGSVEKPAPMASMSYKVYIKHNNVNQFSEKVCGMGTSFMLTILQKLRKVVNKRSHVSSHICWPLKFPSCELPTSGIPMTVTNSLYSYT